MKKVFDNNIKISKEQMEEVKDLVRFIYLDIVSIDVIDNMFDTGDIFFIPNTTKMDFIKKCIDNDVYNANTLFTQFLEEISLDYTTGKHDTIEKIMLFVDTDESRWYRIANNRTDIQIEIERAIHEYYNENTTNINTDNFIEYMSKHRFSQSNIQMIFEAFAEYFKILNKSIALFNEFDGIIVVKQFEI